MKRFPLDSDYVGAVAEHLRKLWSAIVQSRPLHRPGCFARTGEAVRRTLTGDKGTSRITELVRRPGAGIRANTFRLYKAADFDDDHFDFGLGGRYAKRRLYVVSDEIQDDIRSARWNLPAGKIVILYEHDDGRPGIQRFRVR